MFIKKGKEYKMKLTKNKIEEMAMEIIDYLKKNDLDNDVCIYFNNKRIRLGSNWDREKREFISYEKVEEDISPFDYFEYANHKHILSMSFEGDLYDLLNGFSYGNADKFLKIFEKYGLYYEMGNAWNLSVYPDSIDYDEIEYTSYEREPEPTIIYSHSTDVPTELIVIKHMWDKLSSTTQHLGGSSTIGDGFKFTYNGINYEMISPSYQGSLIYEHWIDTIESELELIGATEIYYNYGRLD
jgi:hypothetical protein